MKIDDFVLKLITNIPFNDIDELDLSNNNIFDIGILNKLQCPKLRRLNLSFNHIVDLSPIKRLNQNMPNIEMLILNNNKIDNINVLKNKIFDNIIDIQLDGNKLENNEINEIIEIIKNHEYLHNNDDNLNQNNNNNEIGRLEERLDNIKNNILDFANEKFNIKLTGKEEYIDLKNKNLGDLELELFSCIEFMNAEEINLQHNNISNPGILRQFICKKVKKIDLSFNRIIDVFEVEKL